MHFYRSFDDGSGVSEEVEGRIQGCQLENQVRVLGEAEREDEGMELLALAKGSPGGETGEQGGEGADEEARG